MNELPHIQYYWHFFVWKYTKKMFICSFTYEDFDWNWTEKEQTGRTSTTKNELIKQALQILLIWTQKCAHAEIQQMRNIFIRETWCYPSGNKEKYRKRNIMNHFFIFPEWEILRRKSRTSYTNVFPNLTTDTKINILNNLVKTP